MTKKIDSYYFDVEGKAEAVRLALAVGGVSFNDHRLKREDWPAFKATLPYSQQMPVMKIDDGEFMTQSGAMLRYVCEDLCRDKFSSGTFAINEAGEMIND